jgi:Tol biopolymer transport system component/DNA-binding winged helix-turn-helix (wHTH) protein
VATIRVGAYVVDPSLNRIATPAGETVQVEPKIMQVLLALAERPGEVVSRDDLMARVWNGVFVTDDALHRAIRELRRLFADDAESPKVIETIRKRGYRLIAPVESQVTVATDPDRRPQPEPAVTAPSRRHLVAAAAVVLIAVAAAARFAQSDRDDRPAAPAVRFVPMTSDAGNEVSPALSASGRLAYVTRGQDGRAHVFVKPAPDAAPVQVTRGDAADYAPAWSPDESQIAFTRAENGGCHILIAGADGRELRTIAPCLSRDEFQLSWSPDGRTLAAAAGDGTFSSPARIVLLSLADGTHRAITEPPAGHAGDLMPAFSPDGRSVAFVRVVSGGVTSLCVVPSDGGAVRTLTQDAADVLGADWTPDGRSLIFSSDRAGAISLWRIDAQSSTSGGGKAELLAGGGAKLKHPSVARRTGTVAYEEWQYEINLREQATDGLDSTDGNDAADAPASISATADRWNFHPQISPDGRRIVFQSTRSGGYEYWLSDRDGSNARPITRSGEYKSMPRWSPDSRQVAFTTRLLAARDGRGGSTTINVIDVDTGAARTIARTAGAPVVVTGWSHDGSSLYAGGNAAGDGIHLYRVDARSGVMTRIHEGGFAAIESLDGRWLYVGRLDRAGIWRMPVAGGDATLVTSATSGEQWPNWGVTDRGLFFVGYPDAGEPQLFIVDSDSSSARPSIRLPDLAWPGVALPRSGTRVVYAHADRRSANIGGLSYRETP